MTEAQNAATHAAHLVSAALAILDGQRLTTHDNTEAYERLQDILQAARKQARDYAR